MVRIELDEKEVKTAIEYYVAKRFNVSPDCIRKADLCSYTGQATVTLEEEDDE